MSIKVAGIDGVAVAKMLAAGGLLGGGVGAGVILARHINALREKARKAQDTSYDDDVLYLNLPKKQASDANSAATFAAGGLAAVGGSVLAYNLVRNMHNQMRKRQLQKELDRAQQVYLGTLSGGQTKEAGNQFSILTKGVGGAYMVSALAALGSAIVANKILQKQFPALRKPTEGKPRKIVVRTQDENAAPIEEVSDTSVTPDSVENLARMHMASKTASADSGFADLVSAIAAGRGSEIKKNIEDYGLDAAFDLVKGARFEEIPQINKEAAIIWMCQDHLVRDAIAPLLASELWDAGTGHCKLALSIDEMWHEDLIGIANAAVISDRQHAFGAGHEKAASEEESSLIPGPLRNLFLAHTLNDILSETTDNSAKDVLQSGDNTPSSEDSLQATKGSPVVEAEDDAALKFMRRNGKSVANVLAKTT